MELYRLIVDGEILDLDAIVGRVQILEMIGSISASSASIDWLPSLTTSNNFLILFLFVLFFVFLEILEHVFLGVDFYFFG